MALLLSYPPRPCCVQGIHNPFQLMALGAPVLVNVQLSNQRYWHTFFFFVCIHSTWWQKLTVLGGTTCSLWRNFTSSQDGHLLCVRWSSACQILLCSSVQAFLMPETSCSMSRGWLCVACTANLSVWLSYFCSSWPDFVIWGTMAIELKVAFLSKGWTNTWTEANTECNQVRRERCLCPGFYFRVFGSITWIS